jgi:Transcription factor WhiB
VDLASLLTELALMPRLPGARCKHHSTLFDAPTPAAVEIAQSVCATCPCRQPCADYWLGADHPPVVGVVGGVLVRPGPPRRGDGAGPWLPAHRHAEPAAPLRDRAAAWLRGYLQAHDDSARSDEIIAAAAAAGVQRHQLFRARRQLGIAAERHGLHTIWKTA